MKTLEIKEIQLWGQGYRSTTICDVKMIRLLYDLEKKMNEKSTEKGIGLEPAIPGLLAQRLNHLRYRRY